MPVGGVTIQPLNDHRTPSSAGAYGQAEIALASKLTLNAGGRFDWFSTFGTMASPRVALIFLPTPKTSLRYVFGEAFNPPTSFELYHSDGVAYTANPSLQPELIRSHEVIVDHDLARWLRITGGCLLQPDAQSDRYQGRPGQRVDAIRQRQPRHRPRDRG